MDFLSPVWCLASETTMKIGILGTGNAGHALAEGFLTLGHQVMLGSRSGQH
ncbi:NAD(P)-binding domain-containing protein, partial [Streptococcus suis]